MAILRRMPPTFAGGHQLPNGGFTDDLEEMQQWVLRLDGTYVAIQGPPGTGKTYTAAHLIHCLVKAGKRVGITAMSHHAIDNLLEEVVAVFTKAGDLSLLHAVRKVDGSHLGRTPLSPTTSPTTRVDDPRVGGTTWLFSRAEMRAHPSTC
jgi:uncharacterized protein